MKIYGDVWFSTSNGLIGIVSMNNGYEDKAYIGIATNGNKEQDIQNILSHGTPFPFDQAISMTGGKE